jgi:NNMT/PNMT/TEMT family protein
MRRDQMYASLLDVTRKAYQPECRLSEDPMSILRAKTVIRQGSIFDLPKRTWDAATMFFCAESITERQDEFECACAAYANCVKPGGTLAAAFLVRSAGYVVADRLFPALRLSAETIEKVFARHTGGLKAHKIGISQREIRSGYSGFVFLTGTARQRRLARKWGAQETLYGVPYPDVGFRIGAALAIEIDLDWHQHLQVRNHPMPLYRVRFDSNTWREIHALMQESGKNFQDLTNEAFADLLEKHEPPGRNDLPSRIV